MKYTLSILFEMKRIFFPSRYVLISWVLCLNIRKSLSHTSQSISSFLLNPSLQDWVENQEWKMVHKTHTCFFLMTCSFCTNISSGSSILNLVQCHSDWSTLGLVVTAVRKKSWEWSKRKEYIHLAHLPYESRGSIMKSSLL